MYLRSLFACLARRSAFNQSPPGSGAPSFSATTERCDEMMLVMSERACEAIRSLNTFEIIDWDHL
jgi:hypothetical protein